MNRSWLSIAILFAIVIVGFLALYLRTTDGVVPAREPEPPIRIEGITYEHSFEDGTHFFSGTATVPTRCTPLTATTTLSDGVIRVELAAERIEGVCLELRTERSFDAEIEAPEGTAFEFYGNGEPVAATTTP